MCKLPNFQIFLHSFFISFFLAGGSRLLIEPVLSLGSQKRVITFTFRAKKNVLNCLFSSQSASHCVVFLSMGPAPSQQYNHQLSFDFAGGTLILSCVFGRVNTELCTNLVAWIWNQRTTRFLGLFPVHSLFPRRNTLCPLYFVCISPLAPPRPTRCPLLY